MNDISVKIVESPKEQVNCVVPIRDHIQNERDPLAIDEAESSKDPLKIEQNDVEEKAGNCDENDAKDFMKKDSEELKSEVDREEIKEDKIVEEEKLSENGLKTDNLAVESSIAVSVDSPTVNDVKLEIKSSVSDTVVEPVEKTERDKVPVVTEQPVKVSNSPELIKELGKPLVSDNNIVETVNLEIDGLEKEKQSTEEVQVTIQTEEKEQSTEVIEVADPVLVEAVVVKVKSEENSPKSIDLTAVETKAPEVVESPKLVDEQVETVVEEKVEVIEKPKIVKEEKIVISEVKKEPLENLKNVLKRPFEDASDDVLEKKSNTQFPIIKRVTRSRTVSLGDEVKSNPIRKNSIEEKPVEIMTEVKENKTELIKKIQKPMNGDIQENATKRRTGEEIETESPFKKLCQEIEKNYPGHDNMLTEFIQNTTKNNVDEIQKSTELLLSEIQTLRELAQKKEHEWNNILHLKKVKEELLLRLLRQKQVLAFEKSVEVNGTERPENYDFLNQPKNYAIDKSDEISGVAIKPPPMNTPPLQPPMQAPVLPVSSHYSPIGVLPPPYDKAAHLHNMQNIQKNMFPGPMMLPNIPGFPRDLNGQMSTNFGLPMGRQGPTKDVKSIIADYRQRNPDITPRRGRRMKSILNPNSIMTPPRAIAPKVGDLTNLNLSNMNNLNNLGMIFNNLDMNQKAMLERLSQMQTTNLPNGVSFKDVLVQFSNLQPQNPNIIPCRPEMMPRAPDHHQLRPDVSRMNRRDKAPTPHEELHIPIKPESRHASPTPRLPPPPPYPEISLMPVSSSNQDQQATVTQQNSLLHGILTKNCGEITITPVQSSSSAASQQAEPVAEKPEEVVQLDDEETQLSDGEGSASVEGDERRLVIDETGTAEETPLCQGCRRRDAQFVCAGCANQWYCSRDCQVAAWDEHSEMCSG